uniref:Uncharacterized protein n=1 Tax=Rhizophora mucronata TaxID=61149 RepID=A0A2P2Q7P9_RHIMU
MITVQLGMNDFHQLSFFSLPDFAHLLSCCIMDIHKGITLRICGKNRQWKGF